MILDQIGRGLICARGRDVGFVCGVKHGGEPFSRFGERRVGDDEKLKFGTRREGVPGRIGEDFVKKSMDGILSKGASTVSDKDEGDWSCRLEKG